MKKVTTRGQQAQSNFNSNPGLALGKHLEKAEQNLAKFGKVEFMVSKQSHGQKQTWLIRIYTKGKTEVPDAKAHWRRATKAAEASSLSPAHQPAQDC